MPIRVRSATIADIDPCERLDTSFSTQYVWRIEEVIRPEEILVTFRRTRLPRAMDLQDPRLREDLFQVWQQSRCFLVAEGEGTVVGYLSMVVDRRTWQGRIEHLAVHRPFRRQGVATLLLDGAEKWARGSALKGITIVVQNRNDPAINLLPRRGFAFRGYIDGYFENGDLGLVYTLDL